MAVKRTAAALAALLLAGACESYSPTREEICVATGAAIGGGGSGASIGGRVGRRMDHGDEQRTAKVLESGRTGQTVKWRNPDSGAQYAVTPVRTYSCATGGVCREFIATMIIDGRQDLVNTTACREPDGPWKTL